MENLLQDMRLAMRRLFKSPGFTVIAVISLALGIGANTAIFSLVNTALLRPLPVENPDQLVALNNLRAKGQSYPSHSYLNYRDLRDRNNVLSGLSLYRMAPINLSHDGVNERAWSYLVSGNYFEMLGVQPVRGRLFNQDDDRNRNGHPVVVLSYNCWQQRFGGEENLIGKNVVVNGHNFTIIGVAAKGFIGTEIAFVPELWFPIMMVSQIEPGSGWIDRRGSENSFVVGRLKPGVSMIQAEQSLKGIAAQLAKEFPDSNEGTSIGLSRPGLFGSYMRGPVLGFAATLMAVVALVLLLACTNLANLLLARATERRKEIAVRLSLGAGRFRLVRQLLTESVMLAVLGGVAGLFLALWLVKIAAAFKPPMDIPISMELKIDWRVFVFTAILSILTGVIFGLLPALQATKPDLVPALKDETMIGGYRRSWFRAALVVGQLALSLLLLICSGLVVRSLQRAQFMNPGFVPQNAVEASFSLDLQGYDKVRGREFQRQALDRIRSLPGVQNAGMTNWIPLTLNTNNDSVYIEGRPAERGGNVPTSMTSSISPGYFQAMGISIVQGRDFTNADKEDTTQVAVINESFAKTFWNNENPIGKRFSFGGAGGPWREVVGVVRDGKYFSLSEDQQPFIYSPLLQSYDGTMTLIARTSGDEGSMQATLTSIRRELQQLDPNLPVFDLKTLTDHMSLPLLPARVAAAVLGSFGVLALILAAVGIFGVMSYSISQRTREIGIRMALGAQASQILRLVLGQGVTVTMTGVVIGLVLAILGTRFLSFVLYGVSALDRLTFICVTALMVLVALLACYVPARRAMKVDPLKALRHE